MADFSAITGSMRPRAQRVRSTLLVFAIVLSIGTAIAPGARGAGASDIPGVPLPGSITAGRLGGAIYDVVYSIQVAPGHVIVASLTGTPSTDFDLYLFDARATSVVSTTGLLTKSSGPTSTESISWPSRSGGTYYIDLNGASDVEGDFRLVVQAVPDPSPPVVAATLALGMNATNELAVPVSLEASDDLSGVAEMAFSADGVVYSGWQPYASLSTWTFAPGDGLKTLWVKVRNGVGVESEATTAQVSIDTVLPSASSIDPAPGSSVVGLRPMFKVTFTEPMDPDSWTNLGLLVQAANGQLVSGTYAYEAARRTGTFIPIADMAAGATYVVTVGNVKDLAGNRVGPLGSWTVTPLAPSGLTVHATSTVITYGGSSRIEATIGEDAAPATVAVLAEAGASGFVPFTSLTISTGSTMTLVKPTQNTTYRLQYGGTARIGPAQDDVRVLVRRGVALVGRSSTSVARATVGTAVNLVAAVKPIGGGVSISFRLYRYDANRGAWVYQGSNGRKTDVSGKASMTWTPPAAGSYYWRAVVASTLDLANNITPVYRFLVRR